MKKLLLTSLCFAGSILAITAKMHTPQQALEKFEKNKLDYSCQIPSNKYELVSSVCSEDEHGLYIYSNKSSNNGFLILAADDQKDVLVGYSSMGRADMDEMPEALKYLIANRGTNDGCAYIKDAKVIPPMITTKWHQGTPYNGSLPKVDDSPCLTGCVGVAMGQIVNYHRYPTNPIGEVSYYWAGGMRNYSVDLSEYAFDFDNIIDDYEVDSATEAQIKAMNDLIYCCASSVESNWGLSVTTAQSKLLPEKLIKHFDYSNESGVVNSKFFTVSEWSSLLYSQLEKGLPVVISANKVSAEIGHAFICDGYDGNGYFHINWGWGGNFDGFFNISSLYTYDPNVDFSSEGFGKNQVAMINLFPKDKAIEPSVVCTSSDFRVSKADSRALQIICRDRSQCSKQKVKFGIRMTEINNGTTLYIEKGDNNYVDIYGWRQDIPDEMEDGIYQIIPVVHVCETDKWEDIYTNMKDRKCLAEVVDNQLTLIDMNEPDDLQIMDAVFPDAIFYNMPFSATAKLVNNSQHDISTSIKLGICRKLDDGTYRAVDNSESGATGVTMGSGETRSIYLTYQDELYDYKEDRYICFMQYSAGQWKPLGEPVPMPLTDYTPGILILDEISVETYPTPSNPSMTITPVLHCEDGYYNGNIYIEFAECDENGNLLEPVYAPVRMCAQDNGVDAGVNENDNNSMPGSQTVTIGRKPFPVKISVKNSNRVEVYSPQAQPSAPPVQRIRSSIGYNGKDGEILKILTDLILIISLWDTLDEPQICNDMDMQDVYYDLNGTMTTDLPSTPGVYIKIDKNGNSKAKKILIR